MEKNVASQTWTVFAFNRTTNVPLTGDAANITANIKIGAAASTGTNDVNPTELEDGYYAFDLTQAETNANKLQIFPVSSTADIQVIGVSGTEWTNPVNFPDDIIQTGDNFARIGAAGAGLTNINLPNQTMDITGNLSGSVGSVTAIDTTAGAIDNVTLVATTTTNTDMRGTDGANTTTPNTVAPDNASIAAILADTADMQPKLGTPATDISADIAAVKTVSDNTKTDTTAIIADLANGTDGLGAIKTAVGSVQTDTTAIIAVIPTTRIAVDVTITSGTTTTVVLNLVDGGAASTVNDFYNGRILIFNNSTLENQVTDITDYDGATLTATITGTTIAPTSSHTAILA